MSCSLTYFCLFLSNYGISVHIFQVLFYFFLTHFVSRFVCRTNTNHIKPFIWIKLVLCRLSLFSRVPNPVHPVFLSPTLSSSSTSFSMIPRAIMFGMWQKDVIYPSICLLLSKDFFLAKSSHLSSQKLTLFIFTSSLSKIHRSQSVLYYAVVFALYRSSKY